MLSDKEIEQASAQLQEYRIANDQYHKTQDDILDKYSTLIADYKRLQSDFEEERANREKYKNLARGQDRNPFVLVLVDGDGYIFDDDLVSSGAEGGTRAAQLLHEAVKLSLRNHAHLDNCRVMVRIYANLAGLSKALSKSKLCGPEKRSLAPFVANFNRNNDLFDFVDAGELKENADSKIRALFRQFIDNPQCKHIYFAACHDVGYITELTPHVSKRDQISLVRTYAFHQEFAKLGLRIESLDNVFRMTPLPMASDSYNSFGKLQTAISSPPPTNHVGTPSADGGTVCGFFLKNACKYGKGCKFLHIRSGNNGVANPTDLRDWRKDASPEKTTLPFQMPQLTKSDNDFMSGISDATQPHMDFANILPRKEDIPQDKVPVNKHQQRLDAYISPPSNEEFMRFRARHAKNKLCNNHHVAGYCPNGSFCTFDHSSVSESELKCLTQAAQSQPCPRRSGCRLLTCVQGHICQRPDCHRRGGKLFCRLPAPLHTLDLTVANYVPGLAGATKDTNGDSPSPPSTSEDGESSHADGLRLGPDGYDDYD